MNPAEARKELVIPLIQNDLRKQPLTQAPGRATDIEAIGDGVLTQAVKELIEGEGALFALPQERKNARQGEGSGGTSLLPPILP